MNPKLRAFNNLYRKHRINTYGQYREYLDLKHDYSNVDDYSDPYEDIYYCIDTSGNGSYSSYNPIVIYIRDSKDIRRRYII